MNGIERFIRIGAALRDFFLAADAGGMREAFVVLSQNRPQADLDGQILHRQDWSEAEYAFNRLFVGPMAPVAPPYSSVYLDPEPGLMGESTTVMRELLREIGLRSPFGTAMPEDHVSLEIDALLHLTAASDGEPEIGRLRDSLLAHMRAWIPGFIERAREADPEHPVLTSALNELDLWLGAASSARP